MAEGRSGGKAAATGDRERRRHSVVKRSETRGTASYETECGAVGLDTIWTADGKTKGGAGTGTDATASGLVPSGLTS